MLFICFFQFKALFTTKITITKVSGIVLTEKSDLFQASTKCYLQRQKVHFSSQLHFTLLDLHFIFKCTLLGMLKWLFKCSSCEKQFWVYNIHEGLHNNHFSGSVFQGKLCYTSLFLCQRKVLFVAWKKRVLVVVLYYPEVHYLIAALVAFESFSHWLCDSEQRELKPVMPLCETSQSWEC